MKYRKEAKLALEAYISGKNSQDLFCRILMASQS